MKKTTYCSECRKLSECTYVQGEFMCTQCKTDFEFGEALEDNGMDVEWFDNHDY